MQLDVAISTSVGKEYPVDFIVAPALFNTSTLYLKFSGITYFNELFIHAIDAPVEIIPLLHLELHNIFDASREYR